MAKHRVRRIPITENSTAEQIENSNKPLREEHRENLRKNTPEIYEEVYGEKGPFPLRNKKK